MSKLWLVAVLALGCGTDPNPHVLDSCTNSTSGQCEVGCVDGQVVPTDECKAVTPGDTLPHYCQATHWMDERGCCANDAANIIRWYPCQS